MSKNTELDILPLPFLSETELPTLIAGPCSAETLEQVLHTAHELKQMGCRVFRAGVWKPRTKPGGFEGNGCKALPWILEAKRQTGMLTAVEVATPEHVEQALKYEVDILWIGARTTTNPFAVQAIADALEDNKDICLLVKNPINPDIELWIGALERFNRAGIKHLAAVHRGFSSYQSQTYRNLPMWQIPIELRRRIPQLPIICDPSHIGGKRNLIAPLSQQALDLGFDGLMIESHCNPTEAWSDAAQQVTPCQLQDIINGLVLRNNCDITEDIHLLRTQIDELDKQLLHLLAERMGISRQIGKYKKEKKMTVLQALRYKELLDNRCAQGKAMGLNDEFVTKIFEAVHEESIEQQML